MKSRKERTFGRSVVVKEYLFFYKESSVSLELGCKELFTVFLRNEKLEEMFYWSAPLSTLLHTKLFRYSAEQRVYILPCARPLSRRNTDAMYSITNSCFAGRDLPPSSIFLRGEKPGKSGVHLARRK